MGAGDRLIIPCLWFWESILSMGQDLGDRAGQLGSGFRVHGFRIHRFHHWLNPNHWQSWWQGRWQTDWAKLLGLWLLVLLVDRAWFAIDQSAPAWDQAEYLTAALTYADALRDPQWLSGSWWVDFWRLSPKVPPLVAIITVPFLWLFGPTADAATALNSACSLLLLGSVYAIGRRLFDRATGWWAALLCSVMPGLWRVRLDYLTEFPLVTVVTAAFAALVFWATGGRFGPWRGRLAHWLWAIGLGLLLGAGLLTKQPVVFFLGLPWAGLLAVALWRSRWERVTQGLLALGIAWIVAAPWYQANWLFVLSGGKRATVDSAIVEGDPALNTLDAWIYYLKLFPQHLSWPLLGLAIAGGCLAFLKYQQQLAWPDRPWPSSPVPKDDRRGWLWTLGFWLGAYLLCSLLVNKDWRYVLPYWPVGAIVLARGWLVWGARVRWSLLGLTVLLSVLSWLPPTAAGVAPLVPGPMRVVQWGPALPHAQVVQAVIDRAPHLQSTVGVLPSTAELNQHNLNFFGAARNFQVYGRQVGTDPQAVAQDARSLDWYLLKTGDQGSMRGRRRREAQAATSQTLRQSSELQLVEHWPVAADSEWQLWQRRSPSVTVAPLANPAPLKLMAQLPERLPPGQVAPVTYRWQGPAAQLQGGLALLTWQREPTPDRPAGRTGWIDDRAIGRGRLMTPLPPSTGRAWEVWDRSAMVLPPDLAPGRYRLWASLLPNDPQLGDRAQPIAIPTEATVVIDPAAPAQPAPELDGVAQLRLLGLQLRSGRSGLESVFNTIGRINQYNPNQTYVAQAELTLRYRLSQQPDRLGWRYALGLAQVLDQNTSGAIATFEQITQAEPRNPWAQAYLAVVRLYEFQTDAAWPAIQQALVLAPRVPEFHYLKAVAHAQRWELGRAIAELRIGQSLEPAATQSHHPPIGLIPPTS